MPRTTSTTKAWKWKYSRLFSRLQWKPTMPYYVTTRRHKIFDLGDARDVDATTMMMPESETSEQIQVLPFTLSQPTTVFSLEQVRNIFLFNNFYLLIFIAFQKSPCCGITSSSI
jgi:hypothetical protein